MAIDTYAKLRAAVADEVMRFDLLTDVTADGTTIDDAVDRAIGRVERRLLRRVRVRANEVVDDSLALVAGTETLALPSDYASTRMLYLDKSPIAVLSYKAPATLYTDHSGTARGVPTSYTIMSANYYVRPIPDLAYDVRLVYYKAVTALSAANTSNELLVAAADAYLYGACLELALHMADDPRVQVWKGAFDEALKDITEDDTAARWTGAPQAPSLAVNVV